MISKLYLLAHTYEYTCMPTYICSQTRTGTATKKNEQRGQPKQQQQHYKNIELTPSPNKNRTKCIGIDQMYDIVHDLVNTTKHGITLYVYISLIIYQVLDMGNDMIYDESF